MNVKPGDIKVTGCRAVVAYCDVTGFTGWMNRAASSRADVRSFIQKMKWLFRRFRVETGFETLPTGDGILALIAVSDGNHPTRVFDLLVSSLKLQRQMLRLIKETPSPRPAGFRVRIAAGFVYRTDEPPIDRDIGARGPFTTIRTFDFLGACLNLGARLLEFRREVGGIITDEALEMLTPAERRRLHLAPLRFSDNERAPRGVSAEELPGLRSFRLRRNRD